jgi:DNA-binding MarR family transcriptional regulator
VGREPAHEAFLAVQRLAGDLLQGVTELLKGSGLSGAQYNVLRILRGAGDSGLSCGQIAERLITRDPDITRLLDRLEKRGLVARVRDTADRRVVTTRITEEGLEVLAALDEPVAALHRRQLGHLGKDRLRQLLELLADAAARPA